MVDSKKWLNYAIDNSKVSKPYRNFYVPMMNKHGTVKTYSYSLFRFMDYLVQQKKLESTESFDQLISYEPKPMIEIIKDWIFVLSSGEDGRDCITSSSIKTLISGVIAFFEKNDFEWNPKRVLQAVPREDRILGGKLPATHDDVTDMINCTTILGEKALIHFVASTGIRPGAVADPVLKIKHLHQMPDGCKGIKVYDNSNEGYWAFLTPEASKALQQTHNQRKLNGEILDNESPLFRNKIKGQIIALSPHAARKISFKLIKKAGIPRVKTGNRYDKAAMTMFRKRFNTILKIGNEVNSNIAEKLMAHKRGLDGTYLTPTREECFDEFKKAILSLTVDPTERQKLEIAKQSEEISELKITDQRLKNVESQLLEIVKHNQVPPSNPNKEILEDFVLKNRNLITKLLSK